MMNPIARKLTTPLNAQGNPDMAKRFLRGGYGQEGFGVPEDVAINGSFALEGRQGYYTHDPEAGKNAFVKTVQLMKAFFKTREQRLGKPIKYIIKPGIGGQHTPFQGIADGFAALANMREDARVVGEYELGKNYEAEITQVLKALNANWDQVAVIPSSKSGSTDETMLIFVDVFYVLLKHIAQE